jgi:hypothetical protein
MRGLKELADVLTGLRLVVSILIVIAALAVGRESLRLISILVLFAWFTDSIDGTLSRKSGSDKHSWLGDNDIVIDVLLAFSVIIYATATGFLLWPITLGYMVLLLLATLIFHSRTLIVTFIGLSYTVFLYITFHNLFPAFIAALIVGLFSVMITWNRIRENLVPFFRGFRDLFGENPKNKERKSTENQEV